MNRDTARTVAFALAFAALGVGLLFAALLGASRFGALLFSAGAVLLGLGFLAGAADKRAAWVVVSVGLLAVAGVLAHLSTGL
jgi:hypothetical protein